MRKKKILILTAGFGAGHTSVAKAIKKYLEESTSDYDVYIQDFIDASIPRLNKPMVKCYEYQTKYFPLLYNTYYYTKKHIDSKYDTSYRIYIENLKDYLIKENPDLIISTFPHASASVSYIKEHFDFNKSLITVITDVVDSNEWIHKNTNMYFVPSEFIKDKLIKKNIPSNIIKVTGVPVDKEFIIENKKELPKKKRLLFMGGGRGLFDVPNSFFYWLDKYIEKYKDKIDATIITGTNDTLYTKLTQKKPLENIKVLGFTNDMASVLSKHDLLITKPGGATLFESINSGLPVVVKKPNIGQEIANANFINKKNVGLVYSKEKELKKIIEKLTIEKNLDSIDNIINNIYDFKKEIHPNLIYKYIDEFLRH